MPGRQVRRQLSQDEVNAITGKGIAAFLISAFVFVAAMVLLYPDDASPRPSQPPPGYASAPSPPPPAASSSDKQIEAWVMAEGFVRQCLKSPGSADFGGWHEPQLPDQCVADMGNGRYMVRGWVDSQNSFGALMRSQFLCTIRDKGASWSCDSMWIE